MTEKPKPPRPATPRHPATTGALLTRAQVAARLGISISTVRRMERTDLKPIVGEDGVHCFRAKVVERLATARATKPTNAGNIAAQAFRMFQTGKTLAEVVIALEQTPATVRRLHHEWRGAHQDPAAPSQITLIESLLEDDRRRDQEADQWHRNRKKRRESARAEMRRIEQADEKRAAREAASRERAARQRGRADKHRGEALQRPKQTEQWLAAITKLFLDDG